MMSPFKVSLHENKRLSELLHGFKLAKRSEQNIENESSVQETSTLLEKDAKDEEPPGAQCLTCKCVLPEREEQISHYKSDWHRYNIKLRLLGRPAIGEEEFGDIADDVLSISGSDSDEDIDLLSDKSQKLSMSVLKPMLDGENSNDEQLENRMPKLYFQNTYDDIVSVYKKVLYNTKNFDIDSDITTLALQTLEGANNHLWMVALFSAGHFAAAVFEGANVVAHKTYHRYIVRAKRGVVQSINDQFNRGNTAKSAGASLRRYNEIQLEDNIRALMKAWKGDYIDKCSHIFLRIPQYRKSLFYGGKEALLDQKDSRIRSVPFVTRRPTFSEVQRVHRELFSVTIHSKTSMTDILSPCQPDGSKNKSGKSKSKNINPPKPDPYTGGQEPLEEVEEVISAGDEMEIKFEDEIISTSHLETFQVSPEGKKKKKKRQKKKGNSVTSGTKIENVREEQDPATTTKEDKEPTEEVVYDRDTINQLFTACKTANLEMLDKVVRSLIQEDDIDAASHRPSQSDIDNSEVAAIDDGRTSEIASLVPASEDEQRLCREAPASKGASKISSSETVVKLLSSHLDKNGNTPLHIASRSGQKNIIYTLLEYGADPCVKNFSSVFPFSVCSDKEARNTYRRFRAKYPDKYEFNKAQIPAPLTEEMEAEMKKKLNEKKKAQRLLKKERENMRKEEDMKKQEEQSEKERFLALSDRDKRLIAVERRLLNQPHTNLSNVRRCYNCAESLFAKVPFEYLDFKFCSINCLKTHKSKNKT